MHYNNTLILYLILNTNHWSPAACESLHYPYLCHRIASSQEDGITVLIFIVQQLARVRTSRTIFIVQQLARVRTTRGRVGTSRARLGLAILEVPIVELMISVLH